MIPSNFRIEILSIRALLGAIGNKGLIVLLQRLPQQDSPPLSLQKTSQTFQEAICLEPSVRVTEIHSSYFVFQKKIAFLGTD